MLYHGSQNRNISTLEPRAHGIRDMKEGPLIFAALDPALASIFITPTYQNGLSGRYCSTCPYYFVFRDEKMFKSIDQGGSIYFLPIASFSTNPNKGLGTNEWVSNANISPLYKVDFDSSLKAMISLGVQVFFVNDEKFEKIKRSNDYGKCILLELQSENKKLNINYFHILNEK
jgi:hypothetical protein